MSTFKIIGGDIKKDCSYSSMFGQHILIIHTGFFKSETIDLTKQLVEIQQITEENKQSILSKAGWGTLGAVALGPVGLLAGLLLGGRSKEICAACRLDDGRAFIALIDLKTYQSLFAISMQH